ncbi:MAG: efflux RND transporter periplasmic adaptor subunit [Verrucomicrobiota bacterium]
MNPLKWIVPLAVLAGSGALAYWLVLTSPEPEKRKRPGMKLAVDVIPLERADYQVVLRTRGTVRARTTSTLIPEVSGRIVEITPSFRAGGFFEEGEILLRVDPSDYRTALTVADSAEAEAEAVFQQEQARAEQALDNWRALGKGGEPSPLVLRKPQLAEAKGRLASAQAQVAKARRDLDRTEIRAPYTGRVLEQMVDVGQFVSTGTTLASIYAVDFAEIRLPITRKQEGFVDLPELYHGDKNIDDRPKPKVLLRSDFGGETYTWEGVIVRTEGRVDTRSRQLFVVAQVDDPYARREPGAPPLKVGLFVEAEISGRVLPNVFVLPRKALRQDGEVLTVDAENRLRRREVTVLWDDTETFVTRTELPVEERLCVTALPYAAEGAQVVVRGEPGEDGEVDRRQARKGAAKGGKGNQT